MFFRFLLVGGFGFIIDAGITYLLIEMAVDPWIARIPAIFMAMSFTWIANRYFTYQVKKAHSTKEALRYFCVAAVMVLFNYFIYGFLINYRVWPVAAVTIATLCQAIISFHAYRHFVFREESE